MNKPLSRIAALLLGSVIVVSIVGCARNAMEPPAPVVATQEPAPPPVAPAPAPAVVMAPLPAPEIVATAPIESVAPSNPSTMPAEPSSIRSDAQELPPRADRN